MNAVDTNVFVYALDDDEPDKRLRAKVLLDQLVRSRSETVLLWQVLGELLACLRRWQSAGRLSAADVEAHLQDVLAMFPLALPTRDLIGHSFRLSSRHSLSHWDSMLLAACLEAGVDTLYSEDLDEGASYEGLSVINPLV